MPTAGSVYEQMSQIFEIDLGCDLCNPFLELRKLSQILKTDQRCGLFLLQILEIVVQLSIHNFK